MKVHICFAINLEEKNILSISAKASIETKTYQAGGGVYRMISGVGCG
jgi:hypothetical protein